MTSNSVTAETSLADALFADEDLYARFVAYSPAFRKFAGVLQREDIASQLQLTDVASMAGVPVTALVGIANGADAPPAEPIADPVDPPTGPRWLDELGEDSVRRLDVRPLLENGHEPLPEILRAAGAMVPGEILALEATFHPVPLRRLLGGHGYLSYAQSLAPDHWRVYFRREPISGCGCGGQ